MTVADIDDDTEELAVGNPGVTVTPTLDTALVTGFVTANQYAWFQYVDDAGYTRHTDYQQGAFDPVSGLWKVTWTLTALGKAYAVNYTGALYALGQTPAAYQVGWTQALLAPLDQVTLPRPSALTTLAAIKEICSLASMRGWMNGSQYAELRRLIRDMNNTRTIH